LCVGWEGVSEGGTAPPDSENAQTY